MRAGQLRFKVDVQTPEITAGDRGQAITTWCNLYEDVPCSIMTLTGREAEVVHEIVASATHTVQMRYMPNIDATCQLSWIDGCVTRILGIGAVLKGNYTLDNRNFALTLLCTETKN